MTVTMVHFSRPSNGNSSFIDLTPERILNESVSCESIDVPDGHPINDRRPIVISDVVLTFWERKEDIDYFYKPENKLLSELVEKLNPSFEQLPVRKDYHIAKFKV